MKSSERSMNGTGENGEGNLCSLSSLLFKSGLDGDAGFKFLA